MSRWGWMLLATAAGAAAVWLSPRSDAVAWMAVGLALIVFTAAAAFTTARAARWAVVAEAVVVGLWVAGRFDAAPALIGATVLLVAAPVVALIVDRRERRASADT